MIAVISHDAGGAEILSSYVRKQDSEFVYVLDGPARRIFETKLGPVELCSLKDGIRQAESVLCGTSWQSDIEFNALELSRSLGKYSIAFLDHWINYEDRFSRRGRTCLPDEIWVGDSYAETIANKAFPDSLIKLVDNPYFADVRDEIETYQSRNPSENSTISILFVCEPVSEHALKRHGDPRYWGYVEEEALQFLFTNLSIFDKPVDRIVIRPHPSENAEKYDWARRAFDLPIEIGGGKPLVAEIADSTLVAGCESMAMVVALLAGKSVISCIPPGGRACVLPQTGILHLRDLV